MQKKTNKRKNNWFGILIFLTIFLGPKLIPIIGNVLSNVSGGTINLTTNVIPFIIAGIIVLVAIVNFFQFIGNISRKNETTSLSLPYENINTSLDELTSSSASSSVSYNMQSNARTSLSQLNSGMQTQSAPSQGKNVQDDDDEINDDMTDELKLQLMWSEQRVFPSTNQSTGLPTTPRFEALINWKVLLVSIIGIIVLSGTVTLLSLVSGVLP